MFRGLTCVIAILFVTASASFACGDKFLVPSSSKSSRLSSSDVRILIYSPKDNSAESERSKGLSKVLEQAGYQVVLVNEESDLKRSLEKTTFQLILAEYPRVADLEQIMKQAEAESVLVPVLSGGLKGEAETIKARYGRVLQMPARSARVVAVVENALAQKGQG